MNKVYVMVGIPGAGKTTYARTHLKETVYIGTDALRMELYGKELTLKGRKKVYRLLEMRLWQALDQGMDVVLDCANVTRNRRRQLLAPIPKDCDIIGIVLKTPLKNALKNNKKRQRYVFPGGILLMNLMMSVPKMDEGFHEIYVIA